MKKERDGGGVPEGGGMDELRKSFNLLFFRKFH
jgi:hypothetical protein